MIYTETTKTENSSTEVGFITMKKLRLRTYNYRSAA
jgi:hypothetical protein